MAELLIVFLASLLLIGVSVRANARFQHHERLPMQWSFAGDVNWTAPRVLALSLTPGLAIFILALSAAMMRSSKPRPGQEGFEVPVLVALALGFAGVHLIHLWLVDRSLRKGG